MDSEFIRRFYTHLTNFFGIKAASYLLQFLANLRFDHETYRLRPEHLAFGQHPTVNDALCNRLISGTVVAKNNVQELTESGVIFELDDDKETPVDSIILATGYEISFPFLDRSLVWSANGKINLFKSVFPPGITHPHTLAIIGLAQPFGPLIPISEMQCRWFVQLMAGKAKLPSREEMIKDIERKRVQHDSRYYTSPRHQIQVDFAPYMDELASQYGVKPNLIQLFLSDPVLWYHVYFGPLLPYQYRIHGSNCWPGARKAILTVQERIQAPYQTRKLLRTKNKSTNLNLFAVVALFFAMFIYIF